jgi:hypothetical protein
LKDIKYHAFKTSMNASCGIFTLPMTTLFINFQEFLDSHVELSKNPRRLRLTR